MSEALGTFTAAIAGAVCLGGLVLILITAQPDDHGVLDPAAFRAHLMVERLSVLWFVAAVVMVVVQAAADAGVAATRLLSSGGLAAALGASETARAWIAVAVCAVVVAVFSRLTVRWEWHVPLVIPAIVGVVAVPVTGNAGQGPDHDYATSSVIVFAVAISVWAGLTIVGAVAPPETAVRRRVANASLAAGAVAVGYGLGIDGAEGGTWESHLDLRHARTGRGCGIGGRADRRGRGNAESPRSRRIGRRCRRDRRRGGVVVDGGSDRAPAAVRAADGLGHPAGL